MKHITSRENAFFKNLVKLAQSSRERKKQGLTLIEGVHLVEVYRERYGLPQAVVVSDSGMQHGEITNLLKKLAGVEPIVVDDALFKSFSELATPTGVIVVVHTPRPEKIPDKLELCLACDGIQDPGNLGSMLRSAAAAGVKHVFLSKDCVFAWSPRVIRAGQGAHFLLAIHENVELFSLIEGFQGKVVATSLDAPASLFDTDLTGPMALLMGNEGAGLSPELLALASHPVKIPMPGGMESLNVAAATAVCLFERIRQMGV
jgi:RNA methyltransferase, TrmH family